jgi:hypothetical protein
MGARAGRPAGRSNGSVASSSSAALWPPGARAASASSSRGRARGRCCWPAARRPAGRRSRTPRSSFHCVSLTTARKICSPSFTCEHVVHRPGRDAAGHGRAGWPVTANCIMCCATSKHVVLEQRALHLLAAPGFLALRQRRHRADGAEHAAHDVVDAGAGAQRVAGAAGHVGQAAHHLHHLVQRGAVLVRAGQKALVADVDQARVQGLEAGVVQAQLPWCRV